MNGVYMIQDGDKADVVAQMSCCIVMSQQIGFCEMCDCYRCSRIWRAARILDTPYAVCGKHAPLDIVLWETEFV